MREDEEKVKRLIHFLSGRCYCQCESDDILDDEQILEFYYRRHDSPFFLGGRDAAIQSRNMYKTARTRRVTNKKLLYLKESDVNELCLKSLHSAAAQDLMKIIGDAWGQSAVEQLGLDIYGDSLTLNRLHEILYIQCIHGAARRLELVDAARSSNWGTGSRHSRT
jgi:hypothetical protein